jgi:hypothetical protein
MLDEINLGYHKIDVYRKYAQKIADCRNTTVELLSTISSDMSNLAGYGASTTTTTLLYNFELENILNRIYDDNPIKFGTFSPGAHIEVFNSSDIIEHMPKGIIILAWVYAKPIIKRNLTYLENGGVFIIPLPVPRKIDITNVQDFLIN